MIRGNNPVPQNACVIQLYKHKGDDLIACEAVHFPGGSAAVELTLRRASISGRVEIGGKIEAHFADLLDKDASLVETVALDADSYGALKNRWMRTRLERP